MHRKGHLSTTPPFGTVSICQYVPARSSCLVSCSNLLSWAICEISRWKVCVFSTLPVSDLRSDSAGLSKIDVALCMGPGWISGLESGCDEWQKFDQSGISRFLKLGEIPSNWTLLYSIQNCSPMSMTTFGAAQWSVCTDFCQEFLEQFSVLKVPDWQQRWQESVISLLCFRIFLIEL